MPRAARCAEHGRRVAKLACREIWGDVGRCGEMWGDVGRYREIWGARRAHREAHLVRAEVGEGSGEGEGEA